MKAHYVVLMPDGSRIEVVRRFGDVLAAQAAYPATGSERSFNEQAHLMIAFQCHRRLQDEGVIPKDTTMMEWVDQIIDITEAEPDKDDDEDPLEKPVPVL